MAQAILAEFGGRFREAMLGVSFRGAVPDGVISRGLAAPVVSEGIVDDDVTASGDVTSVMTSTLLWLAHRPVYIGPWALPQPHRTHDPQCSSDSK